MRCNCLKAIQSHFEKTVYFLPEIPGTQLDQYRKDGKLRWPWSHPVVLNFCINLVITKHKLKSQYVKMTQLWHLTVNCFKVSSQPYLAGLSFCLKSSFTIFLLMLFPLFSIVFTDILKIYKVPKIYKKILRKLFIIIIYQVNSMTQLHLASELY